MIELELDPARARRLGRLATLARRRTGVRVRATPVLITWHAHPDPDLLLVEEDGSWRLEAPLRRGGWLAGTAVLAAADRPEALGHGTEAEPPLRASFSGRRRRLVLAPDGDGGRPATVLLTEGLYRTGDDAVPVCRVRLSGADGRDVAALTEELLLSLGARPAASPLGAAAPPSAGPPSLPAPDGDATLDEALGAILGVLGLSLLHWAPLARVGADPRPVHQMRVAIRRLRSALLVFREQLGGALEPERDALRTLATTLGAARDWDVFLSTTAPAIAAALPRGETLDPLLADAERARAESYQTLRATLDGKDTRRLLIRTALLPFRRPWAAQAEGSGEPADDAARPVLGGVASALVAKRVRRLKRGRRTLDDLSPEALHDARKEAKKLRYALDFLGEALPRAGAGKLGRRLGTLQDALGAINDAETGGALLDALFGGEEDIGADRARAAGIVVGWLAAEATRRRTELAPLWTAVRRTDRFWRA